MRKQRITPELQFLRDFQAKHGLTNKDVANIVGITPTAVNNWVITNRPSVPKLKILAEHFGADLCVDMTRPGDEPYFGHVTDIRNERGYVTVAACLSRIKLRYGYDTAYLEERGIKATGVYTYYYKQDCIPFHTLHRIADACGLEVYFSFEKAA